MRLWPLAAQPPAPTNLVQIATLLLAALACVLSLLAFRAAERATVEARSAQNAAHPMEVPFASERADLTQPQGPR